MVSTDAHRHGKTIPVDHVSQRRTALLFIATGSIYTAIGSMLGLMMIFDRSFNLGIISGRTFTVHPYLQILGFLTEFVFGVAYSLVPSMKSRGIPSRRLAYTSFILVTTANGGFIVSSWFLPGGQFSLIILYASLAMEFIASLIFLYEISSVIAFGRKNHLKGDAYILLSAISLTVALASIIMSVATGVEQFSFGIVYMLLIGFVGSMIFGITTKTAGTRFTRIWSRMYSPAVYAQCAALVSALIYFLYPSKYTMMSTSSLFMISAGLYVLMARTMTQSRLFLPNKLKRKENHGNIKGKANLVCLETSLMSASAWLITGVLFSFLFAVSGRSWVEIAFIHSFGIGFIGSAIIGIAPVLLPGILSRSSPSGKNTLLPLYLLNVGLVIFVAGDIISSRTFQLPYWTGIGGLSIILAMLVFMYELHEKLIPKVTIGNNENMSDGW